MGGWNMAHLSVSSDSGDEAEDWVIVENQGWDIHLPLHLGGAKRDPPAYHRLLRSWRIVPEAEDHRWGINL